MSDRNNTNWFFVGLGIGAFIGYLLNTDEGRKVRQDVAVRAEELGKEASTQAQQALNTASHQVDTVLQSGKQLIDDASTNVKSKLYAAADEVKETGNDFKKGLEAARQNIQKKTNA